ncbi:fibronectin type III and SPRY domain-containing protein 1 isoform X3 [Pan troglodytes]|uniref:fibronectin type III and SPRY domain-containing protein 1 isoform X3 n=1 Tax=Pan troglodytes TaxID=9598 RepID=UPI0003EAFAD8|nr:fibronectin type III and SPRY domain-containing protein 1 isoform X3 [Pan troglodytes]
MEEQREALRKIIKTLAVKNEEIQSFIYSLKQMLLNVEANSAKVQEDLEAEFQSLFSLLEELKEGMLMKIKQDRASRTYELQNQLAACTRALESSEELLETANQTLQAMDSEDFPQAAKQIKDGVTMAPAFRLSLKAKVSDNMSHLMVDFAQERQMLQALKFLPVPSAPVIDLAESLVADNCVTLVWRMPDEDSKIDHYVLEYRRTNFEGPPRLKEDQPWMVIEGIRQTEYTLTGLKFDMKYMNFRVKACNKAVAGEFSEPVTLETPAFMFRLDASTSHQNLRVDDLSVEWDAMGGKVQDIKAREKDGKGRTASPINSPARGHADRRRGALLGGALRAGQQGVRRGRGLPQPGPLRATGQDGRLLVPARQQLAAGLLSFYNARTKQVLHTFKTRFTQPLLPAFTVWCGSFQVTTGLQVPSAVRCLQKRGSATSSSNTSLT